MMTADTIEMRVAIDKAIQCVYQWIGDSANRRAILFGLLAGEEATGMIDQLRRERDKNKDNSAARSGTGV